MNSFPSKKQRQVIWILLIIYAVINLEFIYNGFYSDATNIRTCEFTEFLVNYSGGYVRRGLIGELLLALTTFFDCDPRWFIIPACMGAYITFLFLVFGACRHANCCSWVLMLVLFSPYAHHGMFRKDFAIFLFLALILYLFFCVGAHQTMRKLVGLGLYIIALNIHECLFFMVAPFFIWYFFRGKGDFCITWRGFISVLVIIVPMVLISLNKGTQEQAQIIHNSWLSIFGEELGKTPSGTIASLSWSTIPTFIFHLKMNFCPYFYSGALTMLILLTGLLYIIPNITFPKWLNNNEINNNRFIFVNVFIFQLISLFPMLTILSCDMFRIISYWIISTFLIYTIVPHQTIKEMLPIENNRFTDKLNMLLFHKGSTSISTFLMFFAGMPFVGYDVRCVICSSPMASYWFKIKYIIHHCIDVF